jgi:hypothetical protein
MDKIKEKLKFVWFFLVGIYSYIHRGIQIYIYSIQGFASSLTLLLFKHDAVSFNIAGKWDISAQKAITYATHFIIIIFLYIIIF